MHLHEYQAKEIFRRYSLPVPDFHVLFTPEELEQIPWQEAVVKVQIHAGGRGKAGGVKRAKNRKELRAHVQELLGKRIVTPQTGPEGIVSRALLVSLPVEIAEEYYLALTIDRKSALPLLIASKEGGVEIEEVAATHPEKILTLPLRGSLRRYQQIRVAKFLGWKGELFELGSALLVHLLRLFLESDASLVEINPLVRTPDNRLLALDAKLSLDENALFRHKEYAGWRDLSQLTESEALAQEFDLAYVGLEGEIGCMVNGAGLAMATMDLIHHYGGRPANFLDVGGGASQEKVAQGFRILLKDKHVKAIFVNIFGGIMDCAVLAKGIVEAAREGIGVPLVVRMEGTHAKEGREILRHSALAIQTVEGLAEGAQQAVAAARGE